VRVRGLLMSSCGNPAFGEKRQRTGALQNRWRKPLRPGQRFASWSAVALYRFGIEGEDQAAAIGREQGVVLRARKISRTIWSWFSGFVLIARQADTAKHRTNRKAFIASVRGSC
jgi:hypothetical protein